jgi:ribosomal-protein-alanine N-acetyltransferase
MTTTSAPLPAVRLVILGPDSLQALLAGDLAAAGAAAGVALPEEFLGDTWLWTLRLGQMIGEPDCAPWLVRGIVAEHEGVVVGHAGFHGAPDERGMVEIGYRVIAGRRGHGYARAAVTELLSYAREHGARTARASVRPDNAKSLSIVEAFGFEAVGDQIDECDGEFELVFERPLT